MSDLRARKLVADIIRKGTQTESFQFEPSIAKELKRLCKQSNDNVKCAYEQLQQRLASPHSGERLLAVQLYNELFRRSQYFRMLVVADFRSFLEYTIGTKHTNPLPPPERLAELLREKSLEIVEGWTQDYGKVYRELELGYHYLRHSLKMNFPNIRSAALERERERQERERRTQAVLRLKMAKVESEMQEIAEDLKRHLSEMDEALHLLQPDPHRASDSPTVWNAGDSAATTAASLRALPSDYELDITVEVAPAGSGGEAGVLHELLRTHAMPLRARYQPLIRDWRNVLVKVEGEEDREKRDRLLRDVAELEGRVALVLRKCEELGIGVFPPANEDDQEDVFEDVLPARKAGFEWHPKPDIAFPDESAVTTTTTTANPNSTSPTLQPTKRTLSQTEHHETSERPTKRHKSTEAASHSEA